MKSLELNRKEIERKIQPSKLDYLNKVTGEQLDDYTTVRNHMLEERKWITMHFKEKFDEYNRRLTNIN